MVAGFYRCGALRDPDTSPIDLGKMGAAAQSGKIHRALADRHRARIVDELRAEPDGIDAHELAERLGLHPNTIRWHLGILADAGIVASRPESRSTPGRPRIVYALLEDTDSGAEESYRLLATILTGALSQLEEGSARAEIAGSAWGRYLVDRPPPHMPLSDADATREVVRLLAEQGFRPDGASSEIRMHRCPYAEIAPGIVCAVHLGLISGALGELGSSLDVERLDPFVEPELCIARLRHRNEPAVAPPGADGAPS